MGLPLIGRGVDAREMQRLSLVNEVVAADGWDGRGALGADVLACAPTSLPAIKQMVQARRAPVRPRGPRPAVARVAGHPRPPGQPGRRAGLPEEAQAPMFAVMSASSDRAMPVAPLTSGVWGVVATPFAAESLEVDRASLAMLVDHYARVGVVGLTVLGVFGEAAQLDSAERRAVLETVRDVVGLPLVAGITALRTAPAIEEVRLVHSVLGKRLAGVMVQVNSSTPETLARHLRVIHDATGIGLVVQDYPLVSGVRVASSELVTALRRLPFVVAVKAEAPPTTPAVATLTTGLDIPVFGGLGGLNLLDELAAGAAGAMTGFSLPEGLTACVEGWRRGGYRGAREAYLPYLPLVNFEQQANIGLAIRKECLRQRGLITCSAVRPPASVVPDRLIPILAEHLATVPALA